MAFVDASYLKNKASGALSGFTNGQRAVIAVAIGALLIGGFFFTQWVSRPAMAPLFSNLQPSDASSITTKLASEHVKYKLADGGATVMVPQSKVYQLRLDMSAANLPTGGNQGYTLLDKQGITTSDFMQHVDYQRALEGELDKTIGSITGVEAASVHLVIPQQDVFANDNIKPSASVLVKMDPSTTLSSGQVQSVVNLTASAVEGLSATDVTVSDDKGRLLASPNGATSTTDGDAQTQQTQAVEDQLSQKVQSILQPLVGSGKSVVQAHADLNFDKTSTTNDVWNPNNRQPAVSSEHTTTETYQNANPNSTGVLGTTGVPTSVTANGSNGNYSNTDTTKDYDVDHQTTQTQQAPGQVSRVSVAVLLDSSVPNIDTAQIQQLVTDAAGLNTARGDTVTVSRMPFDNSAATAASKELDAAAKAKKQAQLFNMIKAGATFLIILVVLIVLFIITKRRASNYTATPISMAELDAIRPTLSQGDMLDALDGKGQNLELDSPEALERAKVDQEITNLIEKQPDEVAQLLRSWLADRRS